MDNLVIEQFKKDFAELEKDKARLDFAIKTAKELLDIISGGILVRNTDSDEDFVEFTKSSMRLAQILSKVDSVYNGREAIDKAMESDDEDDE